MSECSREVEFEHRLTEVDSRSRSNVKRLNELEKWKEDQTELVQSVALLANEQTHIKEDVGEIKTTVNSIAGKSGRRWDGIVDKAIWLILGAAIAALLAQTGITV